MTLDPAQVLANYAREVRIAADECRRADKRAAAAHAVRDVRVQSALRAGLGLELTAQAAGLSVSAVRVIQRKAGIRLTTGAGAPIRRIRRHHSR